MRTNAKIYVMKDAAGCLKLGHSKSPARRQRDLGRGIDIVYQTDVLHQAEKIERLAHRVLALHGRHLKGEWFEADLEQAVAAIEIAVRQAESQELPLGGRLRSKNAPLIPRMVRFPRPMLDEIEAIAASRLDAPDVSSVIRELIAEALAERKKDAAR